MQSEADVGLATSYCFPPNAQGIVKLGTRTVSDVSLSFCVRLTRDSCTSAAIHERGWLAPTGPFPSLPRTILTAGYEKQEIPDVALEALRRGMARVHPELAKKEIVETRLCWCVLAASGPITSYHSTSGRPDESWSCQVLRSRVGRFPVRLAPELSIALRRRRRKRTRFQCVAQTRSRGGLVTLMSPRPFHRVHALGRRLDRVISAWQTAASSLRPVVLPRRSLPPRQEPRGRSDRPKEPRLGQSGCWVRCLG